MARFSSDPRPATRRIIHDSELLEDYLEASPVGNSAAVDVVQGERTWGALDLFQRGERDFNSRGARVYTPSEFVYVETLLHQDLLFGESPWFDAYTSVTGRPRHVRSSDDRVPVGQLETSPGAERREDEPIDRYWEMIDYLAEQVPYPIAEFTRFAVRIDYPPVPIELVLSNRVRPE